MRKQYTKVEYNSKGEKKCTSCGVYKTSSDFHKYSKAQDGLKPWCKKCVRSYDQEEDSERRVLPIKRNGDLIHCRRCERYLDKDSFPKLRKNGKYISYTYCIDCDNMIGHLHNIKRYGLTREDFVALEKSQNNVCKICQKPETRRNRLSVDHDHNCCPGPNSCGKCVRALLCSRCNKVLGQVEEDLDLLQSMIDYLS